MLVLKTQCILSAEAKETLRRNVEEKTGEPCLILDGGSSLERVRVKKDQPLWKRLVRRG